MNELLQSLLIAFCLMLILEGVVPFLYPRRWRNLVQKIAHISDNHMRLMGLTSMVIGLVLLWIVM